MKIYYPKDKNGNQIGFRTPESYVFDKTGKSLTDKLAELNSNISLRVKTEDMTDLYPLIGDKNEMSIFVPKKIKSGDCTIIKYKSEVILIDCGGDGFTDLEKRISNFGIRKITRFICSHYHADHMGNFESFLNSTSFDFSKCMFYLPATPDYSKCTDETKYDGMKISQYKVRENNVKTVLNTHKYSYITPANNSVYDFSGLKCRFLNTNPGDWKDTYLLPSNNMTINAWSMCCIFIHGITTFMTTGDINDSTQGYVAKFIESSPDIYKIEHHGQNSTYPNIEWMQKINPKYTIIEGSLSPKTNYYKYALSNATHIFSESDNEDCVITVKGNNINMTKGNSSNINTIYDEIIPANSDLNNYTKNGNYAISSADISTTLINKPSTTFDSAAILIVENMWGTERIKQTYINGKIQYVRFYTLYGWTKWENLNSYEVSSTINENDDLNSFTNTGSYCCKTKEIAIKVLNTPIASSAFRLNVYEYNTAGLKDHINEKELRVFQTVIGRDDDNIHVYIRLYKNTHEWTAWYEFTKDNDISFIFDSPSENSIPNNTNLNNLGIGVWYRQSGEISVTNSPVNTAFRLINQKINGGDRYIQTLYTADPSCYYLRTKSGSGWSKWYKYSGQAV